MCVALHPTNSLNSGFECGGVKKRHKIRLTSLEALFNLGFSAAVRGVY